ncbi:hypothetical protein SLITK23_27640 [Streptomyces lividans]|uniref:Uncharacterized protein n=1 Tax=Streptomyces violaceolatus TaxID=67378 RepID=A0ABN3SNK8_9ACTN|nr:hypothetical protein SLITK23_27640 [Streptomyces lividans]
MPYGVGDQLRREQLGDVDEADQAVHGEDQTEGAATDGDGAQVVGDVEGVLPGFVVEAVSLDPERSRDLINRLSKEL